MKIKGTFAFDETLSINRISSLYELIRDYGKIIYTIDGKEKTMKATLRQVKPTKVKEENTFYIEANAELKNAETITLRIAVRNQNYDIIVK